MFRNGKFPFGRGWRLMCVFVDGNVIVRPVSTMLVSPPKRLLSPHARHASRRRSPSGASAECTVVQTDAALREGAKNGNYKARTIYRRGGCHPPLATRCRSYDPQAEQGHRMTIETARAQRQIRNIDMARKDWPTDQNQMLIEIRAAIQDVVRKGLVVDSGQRRWFQRTGGYEIVWESTGFRQDVPLKGAHKSQ
jgi:hypothetical protein